MSEPDVSGHSPPPVEALDFADAFQIQVDQLKA